MGSPIVLQNTGMDSKKYGSLERYLVRVAESCQERGYRTVLQYESLPRSSEYLADLSRVGALIEVTASRSAAVPSAVACASLIKKYRPSVIHNHFVGMYWKATVPVVGRLAGARTLVNSIHNDPAYRNPTWKRFVYDRYDYVLPVSEAVRASLLEGGLNPERTRTLYLGLFGDRGRDEAARRRLREEFGIPSDARVLGSIAFSAPFKGVDILLRAFRQIVDEHPDVYLLHVGVDPASDWLPGLAEELGIDRRLVWAGVVDDGWRLLNAADIYVQPSRSSEGLPLALMEAMAMGLPVVCTNVSGNAEAIIDGEAGFVSEPDPESLAQAIGKMLSQREHWEDLGHAAHERYRQLFEGDTSVRALVDDYYELAGGA